MPTQGDSQSPTARELFEQLSETASSLNSASDLLSKRVEHLDSALQKFNLGVACWETFASSPDEALPFWSKDEIGYAKFKDKWRIGLRHLSGDDNFPERDETKEWPFTEAPRELRVQASRHFAKLIAKLNEEAKVTEQKLSASTIEVERLTTAIDALFNGKAMLASRPAKQTEPPPDKLRDVVTQALHDKGHETASTLLRGGNWHLHDGNLTVAVAVRKTMLSLTMNPEAERIARTAIQEAGSSAKLIVLPDSNHRLDPPPSDRASLKASAFKEAK